MKVTAAQRNHASVMRLLRTIRHYEPYKQQFMDMMKVIANAIPESISPSQYTKMIALLSMIIDNITEREKTKSSLAMWVDQYSEYWEQKSEESSGE